MTPKHSERQAEPVVSLAEVFFYSGIATILAVKLAEWLIGTVLSVFGR